MHIQPTKSVIIISYAKYSHEKQLSLYCTINHKQIFYDYNGIFINSPLDADTSLTITLSKDEAQYPKNYCLRRGHMNNGSNTLLFTHFSRQTIPTMTFLTLKYTTVRLFGDKRTWCLHRY